MLRSYWVVVFTFALALSASLGVQAQVSEYSEQREITAQQTPLENPPWSLGVHIVDGQASASARKLREEQSDQREMDDLLAQQGMNETTQKMANLVDMQTWLIGIGTALLFVTLSLTWQANKAARDAVEITRQIGETQTRAYLDVDSCKAEYFAEPSMPEHIRFMINLRNTGQTPARNVSGWVTCHFAHDFDEKYPVKDASQDSKTSVGAGRELKFEFWTTDRGWPIEAVQTVRSQQTNLWVHGLVEYQDILGQDREVCFRFRVETGIVKKPEMKICSEGNYST